MLRANIHSPVGLSVQTTADLEAVSVDYLVDGDIAYVADSDSYWSIKQTSVDALGATVLPTSASNGGALPGRWYLRSASVNEQTFFYPESYGATGDDPNHNDGPGIQAAVNAASAVGGIVFFHDKTYYITDATAIVVPSNSYLLSVSGRVLINAIAGLDCWAFYLANVDNVKFEGLIIQGELPAPPALPPLGGYAIYIEDSTNVRIMDCELLEHWFDGILIRGNASRNIHQIRVHAHENRRAGCSVIGGTELYFTDSKYNATGFAASPEGVESGVNIETDPSNNTVNNVWFNNCQFVANGSVGSGLGLGLIIRKGLFGDRPSDVSVIGCLFDDNAIGGALADLADRVSFKGNLCRNHDGPVVAGAGQFGIAATDCTEIIANDNTGENNTRFIFVAGTNGVEICNNFGTGRVDDLMQIDNDGITVRNQGIPSEASNRTVRVNDNTVIGFGGCGITVSHASSVQICDNTSKDNARNGIEVSTCPNGMVKDNEISGNGRQTDVTFFDILIQGCCDKLTVIDNTSRYHDKFISGTVQAPFDNDFVIFDPATTSADFLDDWFVRAPLFFTGGTGAGQFRLINEYDATTRQADVDQYVTTPDGTTAYAIRYANVILASIRIDTGSTGVRVISNDIRDSAAISDGGTATIIADNTPGDFGSQVVTTSGGFTASGTSGFATTGTGNITIANGYLSIGPSPATAGNNGIRLGNGFQIYTMTLAGTPRAMMELANVAAGRYILDICGTVAGVAGVRLRGNGASIIETGTNTTALGFFGVATVVRQTLTGVLSAVADANAQAVLTSIITALTNYGLTINSTT